MASFNYHYNELNLLPQDQTQPWGTLYRVQHSGMYTEYDADGFHVPITCPAEFQLSTETIEYHLCVSKGWLSNGEAYTTPLISLFGDMSMSWCILIMVYCQQS